MVLQMMIVLVILAILATSSPVDAFQFPKIKFVGIDPPGKVDNIPKTSIENGHVDELRTRLERHCGIIKDEILDSNDSVPSSCSLRWEPYLCESYEVANVIFQEIVHMARARCYSDSARGNDLTRVISFPSMTRPNDLKGIVEVLRSQKCKLFFGLDDVAAELYPDSPSPYLKLRFVTSNDEQNSNSYSETIQASQSIHQSDAIVSTEHWVNNFLGRHSLCPYTSSVSKAAVGLSSVKVPVGKVHIVVGGTQSNNDYTNRGNEYSRCLAAELASSFWSETVRLIQSPESEWSTSLVVFPEYDEDFGTFYDVCDNVLQPIIEATSSTDYIGRAWFHPRYDADQVGHDSVIAGHAVPHKMVDNFVRALSGAGNTKKSKVTYNELVEANNQVRMTPHATINILRRSQLNAAAQYEKGLGVKRPKPNSIYVRNTLKLVEVLRRKRSNNS